MVSAKAQVGAGGLFGDFLAQPNTSQMPAPEGRRAVQANHRSMRNEKSFWFYVTEFRGGFVGSNSEVKYMPLS